MERLDRGMRASDLAIVIVMSGSDEERRGIAAGLGISHLQKTILLLFLLQSLLLINS